MSDFATRARAALHELAFSVLVDPASTPADLAAAEAQLSAPTLAELAERVFAHDPGVAFDLLSVLRRLQG